MKTRYPTSEAAKRIAAIFHRKESTAWTDKEIRRFRQLVKIGYFKDPKEFLMVERYYESERKKGKDGHHRRDLYTFLNNYAGELDRARAREKRLEGIRSKKPYVERPPELTDEQIENKRRVIKEQINALRARFKMPECERKEDVPPLVKDALQIFNGSLA